MVVTSLKRVRFKTTTSQQEHYSEEHFLERALPRMSTDQNKPILKCAQYFFLFMHFMESARCGPVYILRRTCWEPNPLHTQHQTSALGDISMDETASSSFTFNSLLTAYYLFLYKVLFSETALEMQTMIESLNNTSKRIGLEMNLSKTMLMTNSTKCTISVDGAPLKYTDQYIPDRQIYTDQYTLGSR